MPARRLYGRARRCRTIHRNTGTKYSIARTRYLLRRGGCTRKVPARVHANRASAEETHTFQKEIAGTIKKNDKKGIVTTTG